MDSLIAVLFSAMTLWVPPKEQWLAYRESIDEAEDRYLEIAKDAAEVAMDPDEEPLFEGEGGREKTAVLLLSIASLESYFRRSVDFGTEFGDGGLATCLMQVHVYGSATPEGWTKKDLTDDRQACFRIGLLRARQSFAACKALPLEDRLSGYTTGKCIKNEPKSRQRMARFQKFWKKNPIQLEEHSMCSEEI